MLGKRLDIRSLFRHSSDHQRRQAIADSKACTCASDWRNQVVDMAESLHGFEGEPISVLFMGCDKCKRSYCATLETWSTQ